MCIIVAKEKNIAIPTNDILENCFNNNNDGVGLAYSYNNKIYFKKGIMTFKELTNYLDKLKENLKDRELKKVSMIIHFRIGTSGGINKEKTHPFIISNKYKLLNKLDNINLDLDLVMCHNGILSNFTYNKELSDTQNFIRDVIYPLYKHDKEFYKKNYINNLLYHIIGNNNKLAFLSKDGTITLINKKAFTKENGVYYSNTTYKKSYNYYNYNYYNNSSYNYYDSTYDYDYDYDYDYPTSNYILKSKVRLLNKDDIVYNKTNNTYLEVKQDNVYCLDTKENKLYKIDEKSNKMMYSYKVELISNNTFFIEE